MKIALIILASIFVIVMALIVSMLIGTRNTGLGPEGFYNKTNDLIKHHENTIKA